MKALKFKGVNLMIGEKQEEYITLPVRYIHNPEQEVYMKFEPSKEDLERLNNGGHLWITQLTFGHNFQPIRVVTDEPNFEEIEKDAVIRLKQMSDQLVKNANKKLGKNGEKPAIKLDPNLRKNIKKGK